MHVHTCPDGYTDVHKTNAKKSQYWYAHTRPNVYTLYMAKKAGNPYTHKTGVLTE